MTTDHGLDPSVTRRWANLRFSIIGPLLAAQFTVLKVVEAPPDHGEVVAKLVELAAQTYRHPMTGAPIRYSLSTIERWYYAAKVLRIASS